MSQKIFTLALSWKGRKVSLVNGLIPRLFTRLPIAEGSKSFCIALKESIELGNYNVFKGPWHARDLFECGKTVRLSFIYPNSTDFFDYLVTISSVKELKNGVQLEIKESDSEIFVPYGALVSNPNKKIEADPLQKYLDDHGMITFNLTPTGSLAKLDY